MRSRVHDESGSAAPALLVARLLVLLVAGTVVGCASHDDPPVPSPVEPRFTDVSHAAGVARVSQAYDATLGDYDDDGDVDVFVGGHGMPAALLRNDGDGHFTDVVASSGIDTSGDKHGAGWGDFDGDGRLDLYVPVGANRGRETAKKNRLYRNLGDGRFADVATSAGVTDPAGRSRSVAWLDANLDGRLDLLVSNLLTPNRLFLGNGDGTFAEAGEAFGIASPAAVHVAWGDLNGDRAPDLIYAGTPKGLRVLMNEGGKRFVDRTGEAGLENLGHSVKGMTLGDVDGDGDLDVYLGYGVDFTDSVLVGDDGRVRFAILPGAKPAGFDFETPAHDDVAPAFEVLENGYPLAADRIWCGRDTQPAGAGFTCAASAAASDGVPARAGFLVWRDPRSVERDAADAPVWRWHARWNVPGDHQITGYLRGASNAQPADMTHPPEAGGALWLNDGHGRFVRAKGDGLDHAANCHLVQLADVNDDGTLDLYVVDSGVEGRGGHNALFLGRGDATFVRASEQAGAGPDSGNGRGSGAHFFDFDGDGRLDLFLTNGWGLPPFDQGPYRLLRNDTAVRNAWLAIVLEGTRSNRSGLGAWIDVEACGRKQTRFQNGLANGYSQSLVPAHFGLGACDAPATVRVRWPSGTDQVVDGVAPGRTLHVREPDAVAAG
ncbi:CRTAC1 family protein [Candidatus Binatia bacterium]|nr:CRTAC1 family protein [Candidatus Binatia bacterium]